MEEALQVEKRLMGVAGGRGRGVGPQGACSAGVQGPGEAKGRPRGGGGRPGAAGRGRR